MAMPESILTISIHYNTNQLLEIMTADNTVSKKASGNDFVESSVQKTAHDYDIAVGKVASMMQQEHGGLNTGDLAELRRISPQKPFTPALWRVLIELGLDKPPGGQRQTDWERKWATLLMGMAICNGLHDYDTPFGKALAEAGWSELRFAQLMQTSGTTLEIHIRRVAQFLASKNQKSNWADVRKLLFYQEGKIAEEIRITISRHYYQALFHAEH